MALMENYDYFKENVAVAEGSEGELTKQQKIFEESWEASSQRVKAAIEGVYQALLDDKFFIKLNDLIAGALGGVENFVEGIGGIGPIIAGVASIIVGSFANKIPDAIRTASYNLSVLTKGSEAAYQKIQAQTKAASEYAFSHGIKEDSSSGVEIQNANELLAAKNKLAIVQDDLSNQENQQYQIQLATIQANQQELVALKQKEESLREQIELQRQAMSEADVGDKAVDKNRGYRTGIQTDIVDQVGAAFSDLDIEGDISDISIKTVNSVKNFSYILEKELTKSIGQAITSANKQIINSVSGEETLDFVQLFNMDAMGQSFEKMTNAIGASGLSLVHETKDVSAAMSIMQDQIGNLESTIPPAIREATGLSEVFKELENPKWGENIENGAKRVKAFAEEIKNKLVVAFKEARINAKDFSQVGEKLNGKGFISLKSNIEALNKTQGEAAEKASVLKKLYDEFSPKHVVATSEAIASMTSMLTSTSLALNSFKAGFQSLFNSDLSGFEKLTSFLMGIGNGATQAMNALRQYATVMEFVTLKSQAMEAAKNGTIIANKLMAESTSAIVQSANKELVAEAASLGLKMKISGATREVVKAKMMEVLAREQGYGPLKSEAIAEQLLTQTYDVQKASLIGSIKLKISDTIATTTNTAVKRVLIGVQSILNVLTSKWIILIGAGLVAVAALVKALNNQSNAQEKVIENIKKANEEYEKAKSQLDSLNTSLENVKKRIEELNEIENPTLLDKEELEKAQAEEASLERQIALQERLVELQEKQKQNALRLLDVDQTTKEIQDEREEKISPKINISSELMNNLQSSVLRDFVSEQEDTTFYTVKQLQDYLQNLTPTQRKVLSSTPGYEGWEAFYDEELNRLTETEQIFTSDYLNLSEIVKNAATERDNVKFSVGGLKISQQKENGQIEEVPIDQFIAQYFDLRGKIASRGDLDNQELIEQSFKQYQDYENFLNTLPETQKNNVEKLFSAENELFNARQSQKNYSQDYWTRPRDSIPIIQERTVIADAVRDLFETDFSNLKTSSDIESALNIIDDARVKIIQALNDENLSEDDRGDLTELLNKIDEERDTLSGYNDEILQAEQDLIQNHFEEFSLALEKQSELVKNLDLKEGERNLRDISQQSAVISEAMYGDNWRDAVQSQLNSQLGSYSKIDFNQYLKNRWNPNEDNFGIEINNLIKQLPEDFLKQTYAMGLSPEEYARAQILAINEEMQEYQKALEGTYISLDQLRNDKRWSDTFLPDLKSISMEGVNSIDDIIAKLKELHTEVEQLDFLGDLTDITKAISGLKIGDILDEEDYSLLVKYNGELAKYFMYTSGGYKYMGGADDELRKISLNDQIEGAQAYKNFYERGTSFQNKIGRDYDTSLFTDANYWVSTKQYDTLSSSLSEDLVDFIKQNTNDKELKNLDVSQLFSDLTSDDAAVQEAARNLVVKFFQAFNEAMETGASYTDEKIQGLLFEASVKTWEDLQNFLAENNITDENQIANYQSTLIENLSSEAGIDYDEVKDYAKNLREVNENLKDEVALSERIALAEKKQNKGIEDLTNNYENYAEILKEASLKNELKNTEKYSNAITNLRKDLSLLTGVEKDVDKVFDDNFINSDEVQQTLLDISNGVDGATEKLKALAAMQEIRVNLNDDAAKLALDGLQEEIIALNQDDTIEIGATINDSAALNGLAELLNQSSLTAEQIQKIFNDLGWQPEMSYTEMTVDEANKVGTWADKIVWVPNAGGFGWHQEKLSDYGSSGVDGSTVIRIPSINSKKGFTRIDPPNKGFSSGKKSSGGGGGGGSSKHAEKKNDSDKERYHTVLNQLEDLKAEYDDISKAKDRAFGQDRVDFLDGEISKTDALIKKQKEYVEAIKAYLPVDKAIMDATYKDLIGGPEIKYDERGNISNFDEIQDAMFNKYNEMTEKFTDDSEEWDVFEKQYEQLQKYIEQYEETYDLLRDQEQEYQDLINQRIDLQLEKVQYKVEVKLDISEDEVAVLEYQLGKVEDDAFKSLEAIGLLTAKANELYTQIQINKQGLNEALKLSLSAAEISELLAGNLSVLDNKNFTDDQISAIKEYRDSLLDLNGELDDVRENIEDKVLDAFDAWNEKLTTGSDILDHYGTILENFKNIVDIVGEDTLGISDEFMTNLSQGTVDNAINKVRATKNIAESVVKAQEEAQKSLDEARARGDAQAQEMWENTLKSIDEQAREAQENFMQAWEDALSGLADQFEQTVDRVVNNFNKSVYAVGGLEGLGDDFQKQKDDSDLMLDDYQKIYELSKLSRDINKTIDDTDVISGKQKLKKLLEQVNDLQADGVEMSQYDLEYLQKTYDLRLAELELEEAQRAKNTVRLQKDNEGNWSYIYTQSSDAIDSAQQKYEDALYAMQDLSSNYIDEMSEKLIDTSQEMADALAALRVQDFASLDDYYKEVQRVQDEYQERMALQENELNKAIANNKDLYDQDWTNYHNATGYKISDTENFATAFKDTLLGILMDSDSDTANFTDILGQSVQDLTAGLLGAAETYYRNLEEAMNAAGTSTGGFAEDAKQGIDEIVSKSDEGAQAVEDMSNRMNDAMTGVIDTVKTWQQTYGEAMEKIIQSNMDVINSFNDMLAALGADANNISIKYDITRGDEGIQRFASGGYTGEWGTSGKLAVLDEKEMVLNQNDTANMLDMLQITRDIISAIDTGATYASLGFGNLTAATIRDQGNNVLEQNVHITAEFPNATDHSEIEMALRSLQNTASQYANRK